MSHSTIVTFGTVSDHFETRALEAWLDAFQAQVGIGTAASIPRLPGVCTQELPKSWSKDFDLINALQEPEVALFVTCPSLDETINRGTEFQIGTSLDSNDSLLGFVCFENSHKTWAFFNMLKMLEKSWVEFLGEIASMFGTKSFASRVDLDEYEKLLGGSLESDVINQIEGGAKHRSSR